MMRVLAAIAIAVLAASCGRAPAALVFVDPAAALDRAQVEAAARPLIELGMTPAVFSVANGDTSGDDFTRRLDAAGLLRSGQIAPSAIALYISFEPRYSELRVFRLPGYSRFRFASRVPGADPRARRRCRRDLR